MSSQTSDSEQKQTQPIQNGEKQGSSATGGPDGAGDEQTSKISKLKRPLIVVLIIIVVGIIAFSMMRNHDDARPGFVRVSGRIEGYETNVGAKIPGRVQMIANREGEQVQRGKLLLRLSDEDIQAQLRGAQAKYAQSLEQVHEAEAQLQVAKEQVTQSALNVQQSKQDAAGRINESAANVATQKANYQQAIAQEVQAKADLNLAQIRVKRYDELVAKGAVTQDEDDQAHATYESSVATVAARHEAVIAASKQVSAAEANLQQAKSNSLNPPIRVSQEKANARSVTQQAAALERAKLEVKNARASIDEIEANISYLNILSPIDGIVTARTVEPGAVVAAGQTVISLLDLNTVFMRAYVPDSQIGKIRINQNVDVFYDSAPKTAVKGKIIQIDPQASFTPENIYFRDDRVKQVFGLKIQIDNPDNYAKPGMPADADIDVGQESGKTKEDFGQANNGERYKESRTTQSIDENGNSKTETRTTTTNQKHSYAVPNARENLTDRSTGMPSGIEYDASDPKNSEKRSNGLDNRRLVPDDYDINHSHENADLTSKSAAKKAARDVKSAEKKFAKPGSKNSETSKSGEQRIWVLLQRHLK